MEGNISDVFLSTLIYWDALVASQYAQYRVLLLETIWKVYFSVFKRKIIKNCLLFLPLLALHSCVCLEKSANILHSSTWHDAQFFIAITSIALENDISAEKDVNMRNHSRNAESQIFMNEKFQGYFVIHTSLRLILNS